MSYDLYFRRRPPAGAFPLESFHSYFSRRRGYTVEHDQAIYANEDTGVYFSFEYAEEPLTNEDRDAGLPADLLPVVFTLSYFLPHVFALEAEPEVRALVETFGWRVWDPQVDGMEDGEFTTEGFLRGWAAGNEMAHRVFLRDSSGVGPVLTMPTARIEACWRWNLERAGRQAVLEEADIFIPKVLFLRLEERDRSTAVWTDGIPVALPEVDWIILFRDQLSTLADRSSDDLALVPWHELSPIIEAFPRQAGPLPHYLLSYSEPPDELVQFIRSPPTHRQPLEGVAVDQILNEELVVRARSD